MEMSHGWMDGRKYFGYCRELVKMSVVHHKRPALIFSAVVVVYLPHLTYTWCHNLYAEIHLKFYVNCTVLLLLFRIITGFTSETGKDAWQKKEEKQRKSD